ncbi:MAG: single-stranded DNA-binding protein [candidate division KSB1 bacterium]|nr:single-stranded DNA-binding protein [candidate division KSB1 bacterium]
MAGIVENDVDIQTSSGDKVATFLLSANRKYRDNSGIWRESTCQVGVTAFNKIADYCEKTLKTGDSVLIDGELESHSFNADNDNTRNIVELRARHLQLLDSKPTQTETSFSQDKKESQTETAPESTETKETEPTDFDFGYQNLKL